MNHLIFTRSSVDPISNPSRPVAKGMVWSPSHGDTDFTIPLFEQFMRRIMPDDDWRG